MSAAPVKEPSWHASLPAPVATPVNVTCPELFEMILTRESSLADANGLKSADFLVVDVRRTDFEDTCITGAINLPAQSFHQTLNALLPLLSKYSLVIFHCSSSAGRGPRIAAYYQDALDARHITHSKAAVLVGGIKEWTKLYGESEGGLVVRL